MKNQKAADTWPSVEWVWHVTNPYLALSLSLSVACILSPGFLVWALSPSPTRSLLFPLSLLSPPLYSVPLSFFHPWQCTLNPPARVHALVEQRAYAGDRQPSSSWWGSSISLRGPGMGHILPRPCRSLQGGTILVNSPLHYHCTSCVSTEHSWLLHPIIITYHNKITTACSQR